MKKEILTETTCLGEEGNKPRRVRNCKMYLKRSWERRKSRDVFPSNKSRERVQRKLKGMKVSSKTRIF